MKRPTIPRRKPKTIRNLAPLPGIVSLITRPWRTIWNHKFVLLAIIAIVELPAFFFLTKPTNPSSTNLEAYGNIAAVFMNVAVLYAAARWNAGATVTFKSAYFDGSAFVVRNLLASVLVILGLIPVLLGIVLYVASMSLSAYVGPATSVNVVMALLATMLAVPSIWFATRFLLGPVAVVASDLTPIAAFKRSRSLSLGRFWSVLARLVMLIAVTFLIGAALGLPAYLVTLAAPGVGVVMAGAFELAFVFIWLPYATVYLVTLYQDLESAKAV